MLAVQPASLGQITLSADRQAFRIQFSGYFPALVELVKSLAGRRYAADEKVWHVPAQPQSAAAVQRLVDEHGLRCADEVREFARLTLCNGWAGLGGELWPFQREGVQTALRMERCFIADEPGLGKTVEALAVLLAARAFPALVVCPLSLKLHWERETRRWLPDKTVVQIAGHTTLPHADVLIVNYDILSYWTRALRARGLRAVVFDESQYLKNHKAQRTEAARQLAKGIPYRLALSASPVLNRPQELLSQLDILGQLDALGGFWDFAKRYCDARRDGPFWDLSGAANLAELNTRLRATCFIRRTKGEVVADLPAKYRAVVPMEIANRDEYASAESELVRRLLKEQAEFHARLPDEPVFLQTKLRHRWDEAMSTRAGRGGSIPVQIDFLKRLVALGKLPAVFEWVEDFLATGEKLVLFAWHREVLAELAEHFAAPLFAGDTPPAERQALVDRFQMDPGCQLLILSLNTGSLGLTLTAASNVAFVELGWTPAIHAQAEDRLHRLSQFRPVTVWYLLASNTIDDDIYALLESKRAVVEGATDGGELRMALIARLRQRSYAAGLSPSKGYAENDEE